MSENPLVDLLVDPSITRQTKTLLLLSVQGKASIKNIKVLGDENGLSEVHSWNVADILIKSKGLVAKIGKDWVLTSKGKQHVKPLTEKISSKASTLTQKSKHEFSEILKKVSNDQVKQFLLEAISCFEAGNKRAAVVFAWVGAVAVLHKYVVDNKLNEFNTEAMRRNIKWKAAKNEDELGLMTESDFLHSLQGASIIGKNVKQSLEQCLKLRNSCGHPNTLEVTDVMVAAHIEVLIANVFSRYQI
jgi:hypothetical protein